jgi:hypothetical protein
MGAHVVSNGRYECSHGCSIGGHCPGHDFIVWYREGFYYIQRAETNCRDGICLDCDLLDAVTQAMAEKKPVGYGALPPLERPPVWRK